MPSLNRMCSGTNSNSRTYIYIRASGGGGGVSERASASLPDLLNLPRRVVCTSARSDASIAALVRTAAARRGRTRGWDMGMGSAGAGGCWKGGGASPLCSIVRHLARSAASSGQRAWSRLKTSPSPWPCCGRRYKARGAPTGRACGAHADSMRRGRRSQSMHHGCGSRVPASAAAGARR